MWRTTGYISVLYQRLGSLCVILVEGLEELLEHLGQDSASGDVDANSVVDVLIKLHVGVLTHNVFRPDIGGWEMGWGCGKVSRIIWWFEFSSLSYRGHLDGSPRWHG